MTKRSKTGKRRKRRSFSADQKAEILKRHIKDKVPVSDLCEEYGIQPSVFYGWQNQLLERMPAVLNSGRVRDSRERRLQRKVDALKQRLAKKDNVIAEISEEYVQLKKELGEP
jgi:transposase-like protein